MLLLTRPCEKREVTHRRILRGLHPGLDPAAGPRDGGVAPGGGAAAGQAVPRHECGQRDGYTGTLHRVLNIYTHVDQFLYFLFLADIH